METDSPNTPSPQPEIPGNIGRMSPEEQGAITSLRQESARLLQQVGEHEVRKVRVLGQLDEIERKLQEIINGISRRLGVQDGQQWVALADGTIRLVSPPQTRQNETTGGASPPS